MKTKTIPERLRKLGWNRRVLTFADFERVCEEDNILIIAKHLPDDVGQYYIENGQDIIALEYDLRDPQRTLVAFHEYGHALFHCPGHFGHHSKTELEADIIAVAALVPKPLLYKLSPGEISEAMDYPLSLIWERWEFLRRFGV